jgi:hypothetical protein
MHTLTRLGIHTTHAHTDKYIARIAFLRQKWFAKAPQCYVRRTSPVLFHLFFKQESHLWKLLLKFTFSLNVIQISFALWRIQLPYSAYIKCSGPHTSLCVVMSAHVHRMTFATVHVLTDGLIRQTIAMLLHLLHSKILYKKDYVLGLCRRKNWSCVTAGKIPPSLPEWSNTWK